MLVVAIVFNFYLVSLVSASFENAESEILFITDSNMEFPTITDLPTARFDTIETGIYDYNGDYLYSKTPVYLGNNSWSFTVNSTTGVLSYTQYVISVPNLDDWIIEEIEYNITKGDPNDNYNFYIYAYSLNKTGVLQTGDSATQLYSEINFGSTDTVWNNNSIDIPLSTSLDVYDKAQDGKQDFIVIRIKDDGTAGLDDFTFGLTMKITGKKMATYNLIEQINIVLIISLIINSGIMLFMNDRIDIGGFVNDIPNKKRR